MFQLFCGGINAPASGRNARRGVAPAGQILIAILGTRAKLKHKLPVANCCSAGSSKIDRVSSCVPKRIRHEALTNATKTKLPQVRAIFMPVSGHLSG